MPDTKPNATVSPAKPTTRGRKAGAPAKEYNLNGLSADFLSQPMAVDATIASQTAPMRARDAAQVAMDGVVAKLHEDWVAKGSSNKWSQMPKARYHVAPEVAEGLRMMIKRAANFHGYSVKFGNAVRDTNGREVVVFAVRSQRVRATTTAADDAADEAADTSATESAKQNGVSDTPKF
jgi:hypothetical protein